METPGGSFGRAFRSALPVLYLITFSEVAFPYNDGKPHLAWTYLPPRSRPEVACLLVINHWQLMVGPNRISCDLLGGFVTMVRTGNETLAKFGNAKNQLLRDRLQKERTSLFCGPTISGRLTRWDDTLVLSMA